MGQGREQSITVRAPWLLCRDTKPSRPIVSLQRKPSVTRRHVLVVGQCYLNLDIDLLALPPPDVRASIRPDKQVMVSSGDVELNLRRGVVRVVRQRAQHTNCFSVPLTPN